MNIKEFYKKYFKLKSGEIHILKGCGNDCKSPWELFTEIRRQESKIN